MAKAWTCLGTLSTSMAMSVVRASTCMLSELAKTQIMLSLRVANDINCYRAHVFRPLFSLQSPSFHPYDFTTLLSSLYPNKPVHSFSFILPFHTSQDQDKMAHGLHLTIRYWYMRIGIAIVRRTLVNLDNPPRTHHLCTPMLGFVMGQDPRNQVGNPPPSPTAARRFQESNCPPARPRSSDAQ